MKKSAAGFLRAFFARLCSKGEGSVLRHASSGLVRGCVHTNRPRYASIRFEGLEGRRVFRLRSSADGERLVCAASLEEGKARVRLDVNGQEKLWFALSGGGQEEQEMPKIKTNRSAAKRFKVTGTGKLKRNKAYRRHILTKKTTKNKRNLRKAVMTDETNVANMKKICPYL